MPFWVFDTLRTHFMAMQTLPKLLFLVFDTMQTNFRSTLTLQKSPPGSLTLCQPIQWLSGPYKSPSLGLWQYANQFYEYAALPKILFWVFDIMQTSTMSTPTLPKLLFWVFDTMWSICGSTRTLKSLHLCLGHYTDQFHDIDYLEEGGWSLDNFWFSSTTLNHLLIGIS